MKQFHADIYAAICGRLQHWETAFDSKSNFQNPRGMLEALRTDATWVAQDGASLGFSVAKRGAERIIAMLDRQGATEASPLRPFVLDAVRYLHSALIDELEARTYYQIETHDESLLGSDGLGADVDRMFPDASFDIREAQSCIAFGKATAAVFHLSRVAEIAAVAIGQRLGYSSPRPGFGEVLKYLDHALGVARSDYQNADSSIKGNIEVYSSATAHMHALNQAWRQRVAHLDRQYSKDEADRIYATTKVLMQHLAERLPATG